MIYIMIGDANHALEAAHSCIQAAERGGELHQEIHGYLIKGSAQISQGKPNLAKASMEQAQQLTERIGHEWTNMYLLVLGAEIALNSGQYADAIAQAQQVLALAQDADNLWMQGRAQRIWARAVPASDPSSWDEVEQLLRPAVPSGGL